MKNWKKFFGMLGALICVLGLNAMEFKSNPNVIAELEYFYAKDGTITGRRVNDRIQMYSYDKRGQLLAVIDGDGKPVEQYVYDPAGNILSKTVNGKTTTFTYDKGNQLVNSTVDSKTTDYRYDGAGRLVQEGDKTYQYGYLDKILNVLENGETIAGFDYHMDGQIASSTTKDGTENFLWDGLALIHRGGTNYINEPAVTGGNPILADGNILFNDMLGTTLAVKSGEGFNQIAMTAFGESVRPAAIDGADAAENVFFTGKPSVGEIGYAFLLRNYRADKGKWQTQDLFGYFDGWNNFTYVNNRISNSIDLWGACTWCAYADITREATEPHGFRSEVLYGDGVTHFVVYWQMTFTESWGAGGSPCACTCPGHVCPLGGWHSWEAGSISGPAMGAPSVLHVYGELTADEIEEISANWENETVNVINTARLEWLAESVQKEFKFTCE